MPCENAVKTWVAKIYQTFAGYYQETGGPDILNKNLIERFSTAWRCVVCKKMCSSQKMAQAHLKEVHHVTKQRSFYWDGNDWHIFLFIIFFIRVNKLNLCVLASSELDREVGALMRRGEGGGWECCSCGWITKIRARLWEHVESSHTQSTGYSCPMCDKFCSSFNAYKIHKSRYHKYNQNL